MESNNKILVIEHDIDLKKIINLVFKRKDWGKTYNLFKVGDITISIMLESFNFLRNYATYRIRVNYIDDEYNNIFYTYRKFNYYLENFNMNDIKIILLKSCNILLNEYSEYRTRKQAEQIYSGLEFFSWKMNDTDIIKAGFKYELNQINKFNPVLKKKLYIDLKKRVCEELNKPFNEKCDKYCLSNLNVNNDYIKLQNIINNKLKEIK